MALLVGCGNSGTHGRSGALSIQVAGLNSEELNGLKIQVAGPNDYYVVLYEPSTIDGLVPGIYSI